MFDAIKVTFQEALRRQRFRCGPQDTYTSSEREKSGVPIQLAGHPVG
jgi:hypothetical protein